MKKAFFVTGTDTGCGKTEVSVALMQFLQKQGLKVSAMKPLASGCEVTDEGLRNEDAMALWENCDGDWAYEEINPYAFEPPIAPHIAAEKADVQVDLNHIKSCFEKHRQNSDVVIVEGVGGWLVPIDMQTSLADLVSLLDLEVILVVGLCLGCINHALLTDRILQSEKTPYVGWISNEVEAIYDTEKETLGTLNRKMSKRYLGHLPNIKAKCEEFDPSHEFLTMINSVN